MVFAHFSANVTSEDRKRIRLPIVSNFGELVSCSSIVFVFFRGAEGISSSEKAKEDATGEVVVQQDL